jgi:hypothetical protein
MTAPITMWRVLHAEKANLIDQVSCVKVTELYVWPVDPHSGREPFMERRYSSWASYHETWADAHAAMLAKAELELDAARSRLERAQNEHGRIQAMKPPADAEVAP